MNTPPIPDDPDTRQGMRDAAARWRLMSTSVIPDDPDTRLGRCDAALALTSAGYVTSPLTLATKATRGNGPPYRLYGRRAIYVWKDLLAWAERNTSGARNSTSEVNTGG